MSEAQASEWQKRIAGEWHGRPSLFDAEGNHVGFERIARASVVENGETSYWMKSQLEGSGPLRNRLEVGATFNFGIVDSDENRVYVGPDFFGTGQPYGTLVDANYYSPAWQADMHTWNQVLPDGDTQVYSSILYDGWSVVALFNGVYTRTFDHETNPETQAYVEDWIAAETRRGPVPQVLPTKEAGTYSGVLAVVGEDQKPVGEVSVRIEHEPVGLRTVRHRVTWTGALERSYTYERQRDGARVLYEGPEVYGNAMTFGRAVFTNQHLVGPDLTGVEKIRGREYVLDPETRDLAVVWRLFHGDRTTHFVHGLLTWEPR
ncbi:hypothetical protein [Nocardioides sp. zg-DK7169]|uniref:hypothetical protein n=1 Tax=Nocardioides sp. zg-DK7169 TaxID=2736600 RepID=UPI0015574A8F|nr:hypothetical protein [Nocardioides sp. zg-DK7169]NPC97667.1 hypothetical protein [Nocardioides sp. zg-DK7169]